MSEITIDEIIELLDKEIKWSAENKDKAPKGTYQEGFLKGIEQAKEIIIISSTKVNG